MPALDQINDIEWERDGDELRISLLIGEEWTEEVIKPEVFEKWLKSNEYLSGSYDTQGPEDDWKGTTHYYNYTYMEFLTEHLTDEVVREYIEETSQYKIA